MGHMFLYAKGVKGEELIIQFSFLGIRDGGCLQNSLEGRFGWIIGFDDFRSDPDFIDTFHGRDKEIKIEVPLRGV